MDDLHSTALPESRDESPEPELPPAEIPTPSEEEWNKVRELAQKQLDRFMSFEPKVLRGDDPDAIHDMRVASRRLQQMLDLLYPKPRPREARRLRRRIQRCRRALGEVRNCDVLLDHINRTLARKRAARREAWTATQHYLLARRSETFLGTMRKLSKINLAVFYVRLKEYLVVSGTARKLFAEQVGQSLRTVWSAFEEQVALSHRDSRAPVIHRVRVAAKRLRYLLEVVHAFDVAGSADALAWLRRLQQHLGDWHDLEILEQVMIEMVARPDFLHDQLPLVLQLEKLILRNRVAKKQFEQKYFWIIQESSEERRLKDWVGYLLESPSAAFAKD